MNTNQIQGKIQELVTQALSAKGLPAERLSEQTLLLGGTLGIDSLDLAAIVVSLSEVTRKDPFAEGFIDFRTVGELAKLYAA